MMEDGQGEPALMIQMTYEHCKPGLQSAYPEMAPIPWVVCVYCSPTNPWPHHPPQLSQIWEMGEGAHGWESEALLRPRVLHLPCGLGSLTNLSSTIFGRQVVRIRSYGK